MKIIKYNKLIRDKIPEIIKQDKASPKISRLNDKKFIQELKKKLNEELEELNKAKDKKSVLNELADILEIVMAISKTEKISWQEVKKKQRQKKRERGGFEKKIFLKEVRKKDL